MNSVLAHQDMRMKALASSNAHSSNAKGFSLIELIVTIVVLGVAFSGLSRSLFKGVGRNADPLWQSKATQLSQAYLDEILSMRYQESTPIGGGAIGTCTIEGSAVDETSRSLFDDVDDYHGLTETADFLDVGTTSVYSGYSISIEVKCRNHLDAVSTDSKLITLTVTSPTNQNIVFSAFKADL